MQETLPPIESVATIIFNAEKTAVLLIKRRDIPVWVLPGGGVEKEESLELAALRETKEETGFDVTLVRQVAYYLPANRWSRPTAVFEATIASGTASTGQESSAVEFFPLSTLPATFPPFYRAWVEDALFLEMTSSPIIKKIQHTSHWIFFKYLLTHPILVFRFLLTKIGIHLNSRN